jgi:SAM-dependent methyltransferase
MSFLRAFVLLNRRISRFIQPRTQQNSPYVRYRYEFWRALAETDVRVVTDIGAGQHWAFCSRLKCRFNFRLIGVDVDAAEIARNPDLDVRIVADACRSIGVDDGSVDIITARAAVEHLAETGSFLKNCHSALRPGGMVILTFSGRHAPFAILNRALPGPVSDWLLNNLLPDRPEKLGFKAYYDRCTDSGIRRAAESAGLQVRDVFCGYYSSDYFAFFAPLCLLSCAYDHLRHILDVKDLASYYTVVLAKPDHASEAIAENAERTRLTA